MFTSDGFRSGGVGDRTATAFAIELTAEDGAGDRIGEDPAIRELHDRVEPVRKHDRAIKSTIAIQIVP